MAFSFFTTAFQLLVPSTAFYLKFYYDLNDYYLNVSI